LFKGNGICVNDIRKATFAFVKNKRKVSSGLVLSFYLVQKSTLKFPKIITRIMGIYAF
jgi:hypothetical protein